MNQLIIANWKANKSLAEAKEWLDTFYTNAKPLLVSGSAQVEIVIAPPFPFVPLCAQHDLLQKFDNLAVATQDISSYAAGSYTGAVAAVNLSGLNVKYSIVGHSERRRYFGETNQEVARKVTECLQNSITPVVCIDEEYLADQAQVLSAEERAQCVVAYEPLAAIGTGDNMEPAKVSEVVARVKKLFGEVRVLYGGSVEPDNIATYTAITDGVLVGGASLNPQTFQSLVEKIA